MSHTIEQSVINGYWVLSSNTTNSEEVLNILNKNIPLLSNIEDDISWLSLTDKFFLKIC